MTIWSSRSSWAPPPCCSARTAVGPVKALGTGAALLIVLGGAAAASSGNIRHAATSGNRLERVSEGRFDLVRGGLTIWRADPIAGAGLGAFEKRKREPNLDFEQFVKALKRRGKL